LPLACRGAVCQSVQVRGWSTSQPRHHKA